MPDCQALPDRILSRILSLRFSRGSCVVFGTAVCRQGFTGVLRESGILGDMAFLLFEMGRVVETRIADQYYWL